MKARHSTVWFVLCLLLLVSLELKGIPFKPIISGALQFICILPKTMLGRRKIGCKLILMSWFSEDRHEDMI